MTGQGTAEQLAETYGWTQQRAVRVVAIAKAFGVKAEPTKGGYVLVKAEGSGFEIQDHTGRHA